MPSLCGRFKYICCSIEGHLASCLEKWMELHHFIITNIGSSQVEPDETKNAHDLEENEFILETFPE